MVTFGMLRHFAFIVRVCLQGARAVALAHGLQCTATMLRDYVSIIQFRAQCVLCLRKQLMQWIRLFVCKTFPQ